MMDHKKIFFLVTSVLAMLLLIVSILILLGAERPDMILNEKNIIYESDTDSE